MVEGSLYGDMDGASPTCDIECAKKHAKKSAWSFVGIAANHDGFDDAAGIERDCPGTTLGFEQTDEVLNEREQVDILVVRGLRRNDLSPQNALPSENAHRAICKLEQTGHVAWVWLAKAASGELDIETGRGERLDDVLAKIFHENGRG